MIHPILKSEQEILKAMKTNMSPYAKNFVCFFSSSLKAYITDPLFMSIPLEDKMVHRGYSVFETTKIFENKIYQLDSHINRLNKSIEKIKLKPMYSHEQFREILMKMASLARNIEPVQDLELRYFYSAGTGNMTLIVNEDCATFYAVVLRTNYSERPVLGISERLIPIESIVSNVKSSKSTNYLVHALVTKQSRDQGGFLGIMTDDKNNILETSMSNVAFVMKNGEFNVPPFEKTLIGTTVVRVLEFVNKELIPNGVITQVNRDYVNASNFHELVQEAMLVGGDFVIPILKLNDFTITSEPGPITKRIQDFLINDKKADDVAEDIPKFVEL
jgi:branched-subunit amino acid aminotransferase/4-amino-4-deoxychorismate lyase